MNNPYRVIKRLAFVTGFCIVSCTTALAQQSLFLFLQADNLQPFYVQMGDKVYSSSSTGHIIISGLQDNTCNFEVGFPQRTSKPEHFSIPLNNKDHGYQLIKNGADWALYDWQTKETVEPLKGSDNNLSLLYGERKKDDAFATLMAAVVNDSAVLYTSIVKKDVENVPQVAKTTEPEVKEKQPEPVTKTEEKPAAPVTVPDTAQKAAEIKAEAKADIKTETKTEPVTPPVVPPAVSSPAVDSPKLVKTEPVTRDTAAAVANAPVVTNAVAGNVSAEPVKDTVVAKYDPKEKPLSETGAKGSTGKVVKVQQQTKDGETKMVFVDSSSSPADVVTVYIDENKSAPQQEAVGDHNTGAVQPDNTQAPAKKETGKRPKQDAVATVKKEVAPPTATMSKEDIAEKIKAETWQQPVTPEKKAGDTVTIILESRQMKKDTAAKAKPLYRPKETAKTEPTKQAAVDTPTVQIATETKQDVAVTTKPATEKPAAEEKPVVKSEPEKPVVKPEPQKPAVVDTAAVKPRSEEAQNTAKQQTPKAVYEPKASTDSVKKTVAETKPAVQEKKAESGSKQLVMINSDCIRIASDNDVDKIRVKMLAENDTQKRIAIANKYFKTMCLYAKQMKALSELFPTSENKYQFLQMAYPFAADTANFKQLYDLFPEEDWQNRFKTMVHYQ